MVGNFNAHLSSTNRTAREDISRYIDLNNTIYQQNLIVMWDTPFNTNRTHIFFQVPMDIHKDRLYPRTKISKNLKELKSYRVYDINIMEPN